jgi:hypothetical protein
VSLSRATLWTNLRAAVQAAWPEITTDGIYRAREFAMIPFEQKVASGGLPCVVIDMDLRAGDEFHGLANFDEDGKATIYYIVDDATLPDALDTKLETLRDYLYDTGVTDAQVINQPETSDSMELPLNRVFMMRQWPVWAGAVVCRLVYGEQA